MRGEEITEIPRSGMPDPLAPAVVPRPRAVPRPAEAPGSRRRPWTWQQIYGGVLIAAASVAAGAWYIPTVLRTNREMLTGSVATSGIDTLNFTASGEIARIAVHEGQRVRKGQLLATEYAPDLNAVLAADTTAIRSERTKQAAMSAARHEAGDRDAPTAADVAAVAAQVKLDEAQLRADDGRAQASQILAPAAGMILAANGRPGEAVGTQGIRDYATDTPHATVSETPRFSLLPEGPRSDRPATAGASSLPVIALRTSTAWQVTTLVPEDSVSRIAVGERVTITVPAVRLRAVPGRISEVLSTPVATSQGDEYQALVDVTGHVSATPLSGMAADVRLGPRATARARR
jgi:multidrug efflux pump subunit AcrA (membrane-fusion protein)